MNNNNTEAKIIVDTLNFEELVHCIAEISEAVQDGSLFFKASHYTESVDKMRAWFDHHYPTVSSVLRIIAASSNILSDALANGEISIVTK